jgi:phosphoglycolate phosphatase
LQATGLGTYFAATRCADETSPKPHPAMLLELMRESGLQARDLLMIGDTTHDLGMAKAPAWTAVAVGYGAHASIAERPGSRAPASTTWRTARWLAKNG